MKKSLQFGETFRDGTGRNVGIDLMRLLAMFFIGLAHSVSCSGLIKIAPDLIWERGIMALFVAVSQFPVSLFALITGYVCSVRDWKIGRWFMLYAQVVFYVVLIHAFACICSLEEPSLSYIFQLYPHKGAYWYFNAYTYIFLLMPLLNAGLRNLERPLLSVVILLFSLCCFSGGRCSGYVILFLMYLVGGYLRLYPVSVKMGYCMVVLVGSVLVTALCAYANGVELVYRHAFIPTVLVSLSLFLMLVRMQIKSLRVVKIITFLSPLSFGCYLLQCHPYMWRCVLNTAYRKSVCGYPIIGTILMTLALFSVGLLLDWMRQKLFAIMHLRILADAMNRAANRLLFRGGKSAA